MTERLYEKWWENNLGGKTYGHGSSQHKAPTCEEFEAWMGDKDSLDRQFMRKQWKMPFSTLLDAGCGACPEYFGLKEAFPEVEYTGLDVTPKLVKFNQDRGINCILGSLENIPFEDDSFDVSLSRHVVEHMSQIDKPLDELIRVTKNQVIMCFFIDPLENRTFNHIIKLDDAGTTSECHHNKYSSTLISSQLDSNPKVDAHTWVVDDYKSPSKSYLIIELNK
jgi:ubiquinone/menaquinone biosynthesis C-methylase UbiE